MFSPEHLQLISSLTAEQITGLLKGVSSQQQDCNKLTDHALLL